MCFEQYDIISSLNSNPLKLLVKFTFFESNISPNESDVIICINKIMNYHLQVTECTDTYSICENKLDILQIVSSISWIPDLN